LRPRYTETRATRRGEQNYVGEHVGEDFEDASLSSHSRSRLEALSSSRSTRTDDGNELPARNRTVDPTQRRDAPVNFGADEIENV